MMTNTSLWPQVSIVTPSFNSARYIETAIESVLQQRYPNTEHIIVDGGSSDGTLDILRRYPHLRWISEPDQGQADALNKGFRLARGEIVGWLNADDTYTEQAIPTAVQYFMAHPEASIVYSDCNWIDAEGRPMGKYTARPYSLHALVEGYGLIHTPAVFWRATLFDSVGYLDVRYHYSLDNDFWLRACPQANPVYIGYPLANYRRSAGSKTMSRETEFGPELIDIYERLLVQEPYRSALTSTEKRRLLGHLHWTSGVVMCQNEQVDRALPYLRAAIERYDVLSEPERAVRPIILHFLEGRVLPHETVERVLAVLPLTTAQHRTLSKVAWEEYYAARFFLAHAAGDWQTVRAVGWKAVRSRRRWLAHRGFLSIWFEAFFGHRLANLVRQVI